MIPRKGRRTAVLLLVALFGSSCSPLLEGSRPKRDGSLTVPGLHSPVSVFRDSRGVPHVFASTEHDLAFAQGFVHAQDRLFQMDLTRRVARGELSELFGEKTLPADRLFRHLGFAARAPGTVAGWPERTRRLVQAYCDGVNAAMDAQRRWPVEFRLLRTAPRRFTPEDMAAGALLKAFGLAQWKEEATLFMLSRRLPPEQTGELLPVVPADSPVVIPAREPRPANPGTAPAAPPPSGPAGPAPAPGPDAPAAARLPSPDLLREGLACLARVAGIVPSSGGSNAWVVSGRHSTTGRPILANDPHLQLPAPSLWYEAHLVGPGVDVYGVSFPGAPGIVIGHNERIAWGFTNVMLDDADLFLEQLDGDRVMSRGAWVPMTRREEVIRIRGKAPETLVVRETPHGPIISPVLPGVTVALAFRWAGYDGGDPVGAIWNLNRARTPAAFTAALSTFHSPAQNVLYADVHGNIGMVMSGAIPIRKGGESLLPVPGDTGEWDWRGYVPFSENPRVWNPREGRIVNANFPVAGADFPHYLSRLYEPPDRGRRILRMLSAKARFSPEDFEAMLADVAAPDAERGVRLAVQVAQRRSTESPVFREAATILSAWDRRVSADSAGALLYEAFYAKLVEGLFLDDMGPDLYAEFLSHSRLVWNVTDRVIERGDSTFLRRDASGRKDSLDDVAARALVAAVSYVKDRLGTVASTWQWGRLHQVTFEHPFGRNRYLSRWFDIGPFPAPGDGRTVFKQEFAAGGKDFPVRIGPSMRQVVPLGRRQDARCVITTGQSGLFFEGHYADQARLWLAGRLHPVLTERKAIAKDSGNVLKLVPPQAKGKRRRS